MNSSNALQESAQLCPERRHRARLKQDATIEVRHGKRSEYRSFTLIESTRHGARLVMPGKTRQEDGVDFVVSIGRNTFRGQARVAWTMPLTTGQVVAGLEFLTFNLAA
jgi:hypothetical protein